MSTNSLTDLNNHATSQFEFTDDRTMTMEVTGFPATDIAQSADEGDTVSVGWNGTVVSVIATETGTANVVSVEVAFDNLGPQVNWGTLPTGVSTNVSTDGKEFTATNILNKTDLDEVLDGLTAELVDQKENFSYTCRVSHPLSGGGTQSYTQTTNVTIGTTFTEMTVPTNCWTVDKQINTSFQVDNPAQITDTETDATNATYTMVVKIFKSKVSSLTSSGTGGTTTASSDATHYILTITGTKTQVNSHLNNLDITTTSSTGSMNIDYDLTNNLSSYNSTGSSSGNVVTIVWGSNLEVTRTYSRNTVNTNLFSSTPPAITSTVDSTFGDGVYTLRINVQSGKNPDIVGGSEIDDNELGWIRNGSLTSQQGYQVYELTDTTANLNTFLSTNVEYAPPPDTTATQTVNMSLYRTATGFVGTQIGDNYSFSVTGSGTANPTEVTYNWGTDNGLVVTDDMRFFLKCDILVVGAGGTGGAGYYDSGGPTTYGGGGGGAGALVHGVDTSIATATPYNRLRGIISDAPTGVGSTIGDHADTLLEGSSDSGVTYTTRVSVPIGGIGGAADLTTGGDGGAGGCTGGGGAAGTTGGGTGSKTGRSVDCSDFAVDSFTNPSVGGFSAFGVAGASGGIVGGNGGSIENTYDISGSSVTYCYGGKGGHNTGGGTTPGSGGNGGEGQSYASNHNRTDGQDGVVVLKFYRFT